eukprot:g7182.t1
MSESYSRLLVLVEDTSATSRLWPLWQQHSLEPLLQSITEGQFGKYELCLVAFTSTDSQSNALFQKTSWTTNPDKFTQQLQSLKFEGTCGSHALADALSEAVYLSRQPSSLTELVNIKTHVLICATDSIGRLPRYCPYSDSVDELHALKILANFAALELSVSFLTDAHSNEILTQSYTALAGVRALEFCKRMSKDKGYLALIHPIWHHGFAMHFKQEKPKQKMTSQKTDSHSSSSAKTSLMVQNMDPMENVKLDVEDGPVFQSGEYRKQDLISPQSNLMETGLISASQGDSSSSPDPLFGAVDLTEWIEDRLDSPQQEPRRCPSKQVFDLEEELLGLSAPGHRQKSPSSDRKRKIEETTEFRQSGFSPNYFTPEAANAAQNKPLKKSMVIDPFNSSAFSTPSANVLNRKTEESPRNQSLIAATLNQSPFSSTFKNKSPAFVAESLSRENRGSACIEEPDLFHHSNKFDGTAGDAATTTTMDPFDNHHVTYNELASNLMNCSPTTPPPPSASDLESLLLFSDFTQQNEVGGVQKKIRTESHINGSFLNTNAPWQSRYDPVHRHTRLPRNRADRLKPKTIWNGPLYYLQGETSSPMELFEAEISNGRGLDFSGFFSGQSEMMVHSLGPRKIPGITKYCSLAVDKRTITKIGSSFLSRLSTGREAAVINLNSSEVQSMVLCAKRYENGEFRLVAGFR